VRLKSAVSPAVDFVVDVILNEFALCVLSICSCICARNRMEFILCVLCIGLFVGGIYREVYNLEVPNKVEKDWTGFRTDSDSQIREAKTND
jgi:hypothetical protein